MYIIAIFRARNSFLPHENKSRLYSTQNQRESRVHSAPEASPRTIPAHRAAPLERFRALYTYTWLGRFLRSQQRNYRDFLNYLTFVRNFNTRLAFTRMHFYSLKFIYYLFNNECDVFIYRRQYGHIQSYIDASYEEKHCSRNWTKTSTAQNLGRRKARLGRKERLSCAFFHSRTASCASVRNGLSCAFLRTGRRYMLI